jgi:ribosomal-protein-alanine N-acetyltransferase
MLIERLRPEDLERVASIGGLTDSQFDVAAELGRSFARIWVARDADAGIPIAFALAWLVSDEIHLLHLGTHPAERRRGAARALMNALLQEARTRGARLVLLEVRHTNLAARSLYESMGFQVGGVRQGYYRDGADAIEMLFTLQVPEDSGEATR